MVINQTELEAVENAMRQHLADTRAMFADNPSDETLLEWLSWAYTTICEQVAIEYAKPITGGDVPY